MIGTTWLAYFQGNARADRPPGLTLRAEVPTSLHALVAGSLGRFQLGEAAGGRIHAEMPTHPDRSLDQATRRSIQLYIEEEWRHSRELALVITALGGELLTSHWTNGAFTACRRILGLRTKMLTLAIAEVIGIVYYQALARGVGSPALAAALERIAGEEARHLDFQAAFFDHALSSAPRLLQTPYRWLLRAQLLAILAAALGVLLLDHGALLRRVGADRRALLEACWVELTRRRFLAASRLAALRAPGYAWLHE